MRRRDFISFVVSVTFTAPMVARAQQAVPVVGFLHSADARSFADQLVAFHRGLKEGGFEESRNVVIEYRWAEGRNERLPELAADLIRRNVGLIVAVGGNASNLAAKRATDTIPIVFSSGSDPVKLGLVPSLGRPGGNVTGSTFFASDLLAKQIDLLHQFVPRANVVAVLVNPNSPESLRQPADAQEAARKLGIELKVVNARTIARSIRALSPCCRCAPAHWWLPAIRSLAAGSSRLLTSPPAIAFRACTIGANTSPRAA